MAVHIVQIHASVRHVDPNSLYFQMTRCAGRHKYISSGAASYNLSSLLATTDSDHRQLKQTRCRCTTFFEPKPCKWDNINSRRDALRATYTYDFLINSIVRTAVHAVCDTVCMYIHLYVHMYICTCMYVCLYEWMYICLSVYLSTSM